MENRSPNSPKFSCVYPRIGVLSWAVSITSAYGVEAV